MSQKAYLLFILRWYERLLQVCGLWPIIFDTNSGSLHKSNALYAYSVCAFVSTSIAFIYSALSLTFVWPTDETLISNEMLLLYVSLIVCVYIGIFLSQYSQLQNLLNIQEHAFRVLRKIREMRLNNTEDYIYPLLLFTVKTIFLLIIENYSLIRHLLVLIPNYRDNLIPIVIWVLFCSVLWLFPDVIFGLDLIIIHHFHILNKVTTEILVEAQSTLVSDSLPTSKVSSQHKHYNLEGIRMQICCDLSDRLDEIAVLHQDLTWVTTMMNKSTEIQFLVYTAWAVASFVAKLFLGFFLVAAALSDEHASLNMALFFGLLLSLTSTFLSGSCLAGVSSRTMSEVYAFVGICLYLMLLYYTAFRLKRLAKYYTTSFFQTVSIFASSKV